MKTRHIPEGEAKKILSIKPVAMNHAPSQRKLKRRESIFPAKAVELRKYDRKTCRARSLSRIVIQKI